MQPDPIEVQRQAEARRRILARKRATDQLRPRSAEPVEGRKHIDVQTELYLEEIKGNVDTENILRLNILCMCFHFYIDKLNIV